MDHIRSRYASVCSEVGDKDKDAYASDRSSEDMAFDVEFYSEGSEEDRVFERGVSRDVRSRGCSPPCSPLHSSDDEHDLTDPMFEPPLIDRDDPEFSRKVGERWPSPRKCLDCRTTQSKQWRSGRCPKCYNKFIRRQDKERAEMEHRTCFKCKKPTTSRMRSSCKRGYWCKSCYNKHLKARKEAGTYTNANEVRKLYFCEQLTEAYEIWVEGVLRPGLKEAREFYTSNPQDHRHWPSWGKNDGYGAIRIHFCKYQVHRLSLAAFDAMKDKTKEEGAIIGDPMKFLLHEFLADPLKFSDVLSVPSDLGLHQCGGAWEDRKCFEPSHISWGTHADNSRDMVEHGNSAGKLSREQAFEIYEFALANLTESNRAIAKKFDVDYYLVRRLLCAESYKPFLSELTDEQRATLKARAEARSRKYGVRAKPI